MEYTIEDIFANIPGAFLPEKAGDMNKVVQFVFSGKEAGEWTVIIRDGKAEVKKGLHETANLTFKANSQDYLDLMSGKLKPMAAVMTGKVKIIGDQALAQKFATLFKTPEA